MIYEIFYFLKWKVKIAKIDYILKCKKSILITFSSNGKNLNLVATIQLILFNNT